MATNYPGAVDSLTNPSAGDALTSPSHAAQHTNANDAIEAVQTELGTDPSGGAATVKARFEAIEANDWVTSARIAADAVGTSEIAANAVGSSELADNAVDSAAIATGAVTAVKLADAAVTAAKVVGGLSHINLMGADQSNFETGITEWGTSGAVTLTRVTDSFKSGVASMRITSTSDVSGTKRAKTTTRAPVTAGRTHTVLASLKSDGTASAVLKVLWYTAASGGTLISYPDSGAFKNASSGWFDDRMEVVAPEGATHAEISIYLLNSTLSGNYVDVDEVAIWEGVGGEWNVGGAKALGTLGTPATQSLWVDSADGDDTNPGTEALPMATLRNAMDHGTTKLPCTIHVASSEDAPLIETGGLYVPSYMQGSIVSALEGRPWHITGCTPVTSGWGSEGSGVYSRALTVQPSTSVFVSTLLETVGDRGFPLKLSKNTSTPTTPGEGEFGWASDVLYVKLPSSADPASHTIQIPNFAGDLISSGSPDLMIRDARIMYAPWSGVLVISGHLTAYDSYALNCCSSAWATSGNMTLHRCYGWRAGNDGFNIYGTGRTLLIDCDGSYNDDEGASAHQTTFMEIVGGRYGWNKSGGTTNVGDCVVVIGGDAVFEHNQRDGAFTPSYGGISSIEDCATTVLSATCRNNTGPGFTDTSSIPAKVQGLLSGVGAGNSDPDVGI